jgi:hypothetical protein
MKMNHLSRIATIVCVMLTATACKDSFLDVSPKGLALEDSYYKTPDEVYNGLIAIYASTAQETSAAINWYSSKIGPLNCAADECWTGGGGATDMSSWQAWNNYTITSANSPANGYWSIDFQGIYRANLLMTKLGATVPGLSSDVQTRYIAEAKFLRAYFYFELVRLFKNVPLITGPLAQSDWYNIQQAKPEDVYAQIEKDLNDAMPGLPSTVAGSENGRVTKGAAMALLGKVILFQNNSARMGEAANWFSQVRTSGLYSLLPNFGDIFSPNNKFNSESILEIVHSASQHAQWGQDPFAGNLYCVMVGPRTYTGPTYVSGWSFNPIIPAFAQLMQSDPRFQYTISNIDGDANGLVTTQGATYVKGYDNTGYFIQKYAPLAQFKATTGAYELNFPNDYIEIRFADVLLMEAEALVRGGGGGQAQTNLDMVRARVGLSSVPATLDNIYNERMLELATEGHRWYDLVRTGKAATALAFKGFQANKNELLPIPLVDMNNTKMQQNPGY